MSEEVKTSSSIFWPVFIAIVIAAGIMKLIPAVIGKYDVSGRLSNAVLIVHFDDDAEADDVLLDNTLRRGGYLEMSTSSAYVEFLRKHDKYFDLAAASNEEGKFLVLPAILNWVSSKGWKFQQKFCINLNSDNAEYYFVR